MKNKKIQGYFFSILQIAILIGINFLLTLSDGCLILFGFVFIIVACCLKFRYSGWAVILAYPITYGLSILFDKPHPIDGRLPNNFYPLWYLLFFGISIILIIIEAIIKIKDGK